jgi:pSer/pThr/pTyr-binding forkhead associated (FHA) protein
MPTLTLYRDGHLVNQVDVSRLPFLIGRSSANDLIVIDNNVSRRHAMIDYVGGIYVLEDLHSKNGLLLNRVRQTRGLLRSGDVFTLGPVDITFRDAADSVEPEAVPHDEEPGEFDDDTDQPDTDVDELAEAVETIERQAGKFF